jgi:hypothetical protein
MEPTVNNLSREKYLKMPQKLNEIKLLKQLEQPTKNGGVGVVAAPTFPLRGVFSI